MAILGFPTLLMIFTVLGIIIFLASGTYFSYKFKGIKSIDEIDERMTELDDSPSQVSTEVNE